jgi:hypothetical protein
MKIEYSSNNSGGSWWLSDDDWKKLEDAGWVVEWENERWLGALAKRASKDFATAGDATSKRRKATMKTTKKTKAKTPKRAGGSLDRCVGLPRRVERWLKKWKQNEDAKISAIKRQDFEAAAEYIRWKRQFADLICCDLAKQPNSQADLPRSKGVNRDSGTGGADRG